jgi:tRNA threonylcarbamoyladenosine modification (KEOPS) complex  Pcc1 subunit
MTRPTHELDVTVPTDSPEIARAAARALSVEAADAPPGTRVQVEAHGAELRLRFEAEETRGLRAAAHSYLRLADAAVAVAARATRRR